MATTITPSGTAFNVVLFYDACPGLSYDLERTTNFVDWTVIGTLHVPPTGFFGPNYQLGVLAQEQPAGNFYYRLGIRGYSN